MISMIRLEADSKTLKETIADLDAAIKRLGPAFDHLSVHDEHYERVHDTCFKGRKVLRPGEKSPPVFKSNFVSNTGTSGGGTVTFG